VTHAAPMVTFTVKDHCPLAGTHFSSADRRKLSCLPEWLVTYRGGIPANDQLCQY